MHDPLFRREMQKAAVWFGLAISIASLVLLAQPILLILGALVITSMLDGGTRLLRRILPIGRGWRLPAILLALFSFLGWPVSLPESPLSAHAPPPPHLIPVPLTKTNASPTHPALPPTPPPPHTPRHHH